MEYVITDIIYDTDDTSGLPTTLTIDVDTSLDSLEKCEYISNEISNITGFCHKGFAITPELKY